VRHAITGSCREGVAAPYILVTLSALLKLQRLDVSRTGDASLSAADPKFRVVL
jgi:hypothetical protein